MSALFHISDEALDLEILKVLDEQPVAHERPGLTVQDIQFAIGDLSDSIHRVDLRIRDLERRALVFSTNNVFLWKISVSGRLAARKGVL